MLRETTQQVDDTREERLHNMATSLAMDDLADLLRWALQRTDIGELTDQTVREFGSFLPDDEGEPGAVLRNLLYWTQVREIFHTLRDFDSLDLRAVI